MVVPEVRSGVGGSPRTAHRKADTLCKVGLTGVGGHELAEAKRQGTGDVKSIESAAANESRVRSGQLGASVPDILPVRLQRVQDARTQILLNVGKCPVRLGDRAFASKGFEMKSGAALRMVRGQKRNGLAC